MIDRGKKSVLGIGVSIVDYDAAVDRIVAAAKAEAPLRVTALAVHGVMTGALDTDHASRLNAFDLVTPDGQPVRWALRLLHGQSLPDRVYGPELTLRVLGALEAQNLSVFFFGSSEAVLRSLREKLAERFPRLRLAGTEPSKFRRLSATENDELVDRLRDANPDVVMVGLGCPRQEVFVYENGIRIGRPMLAVGAAFDFLSGQLQQAPRWMQNLGLEWLFRLSREPRRLWRRYVLLNPAYVLLLGLQAMGLRKAPLVASPPPLDMMRYG
jgi:N-acetylglucosaminyldiphosphoundecaprenol N-acetyl-beta-D-mannosaminyltransferase